MSRVRFLAAWALVCVASWAVAERILLIPLDSRPAAGHFAQMIGRMASVEVTLPPIEHLGRFTDPGNPERIIEWLRDEDYSDVLAVIVSTDMVAYGGLIESRIDSVPYETAAYRMKRVGFIRQRHPQVPFYAFSAIMRIQPTATLANASWRMQLSKYVELQDRYRRTQRSEYAQSMRNLLARVPPVELNRYERTRARNHNLQLHLLQMVKDSLFDYVILGQDDAQPYGPHIPDQEALRRRIAQLGVASRVYICEGIDQHSNVLVSRALLRAHNWMPRVRVAYSDDAGRRKIASYESKNVELSLQDQLLASGARPVFRDGDHDYSLFLNVPDPRDPLFEGFLQVLIQDIEQGFPIAVADINLANNGTGDPRLFQALWENHRMQRMLSYAGWNTAGNTMGTAIPAANVYLLARKIGVDPLQRELALREFILHRFVNDFAYHSFTRPRAYELIDSLPRASREETYGTEFDRINTLVQVDLAGYLDRYFREQFLGQRFFAGTEQYEITSLNDVRIELPWPRAYEVRLEFRIGTAAVSQIENPNKAGGIPPSQSARARYSPSP